MLDEMPASIELPMLDIDHINIGPYIRNTLAVDKNSTPRAGAVRHLPRDASRRAADASRPPRAMFHGLFFDARAL